MVDEKDYRLPANEQTEQQQPKRDPKVIEALEALPWRPHGDTW